MRAASRSSLSPDGFAVEDPRSSIGIKYKKTSNINEAGLICVVMCSIRQSAVDRVHGLVQKFKALRKSNPKLKTILTGCVLKKDKKIFVKDFDYVIDIRNIKKIPQLLKSKSCKVSDRTLYKMNNYF